MEFISLKPEKFGIEISDSAVRIAKLKPEGKFFNLQSWGEEKIAPGIVEEGEIKDQEALVGVIKKTLRGIKGKKIKTRYLTASLPESKAFLRVIRMPKMTKSELQSAVPFEAENYIPLPAEDIYLDFQTIGFRNLSQQVLIVACPRAVVDSYFALFRKANLFPAAFETESIAICRALIGEENPSSPMAVLDAAETKADFIIFSKGSVKFTSAFPIADQDSSSMAKQIKKYLNYYYSHDSAEGEVKKVLLSGENGNLGKLAVSLSEDLKIKTELGNPWTNILPKKKKPPLPPSEVLSYTTVLGLALRGTEI